VNDAMHTATGVHNGAVKAYGQPCDKPCNFLTLTLILTLTVTIAVCIHTHMW